MNTTIIILLYLILVVIIYYTNKKLIKKYEKENIWGWEDVKFNIFASFTIIFSLILWIYLIKVNLPSLSEEPPKWL